MGGVGRPCLPAALALVAGLVTGCTQAVEDPLGHDIAALAMEGVSAAPVLQVVTATLPPSPRPATGTPTSSPVPTAVPATPVADLTASALELLPGACVEVRWSVIGARKVRLSGREVAASGGREACLDTDTTFFLWFEGPDGRPGERSLTVKVIIPSEVLSTQVADVPAADRAERRGATLAPTIEPTPCETECAALEPPTEEPKPTRPPRSTPEPTPEPTEEPPPTDEPEPTAEPAPTNPPEPSPVPPGP